MDGDSPLVAETSGGLSVKFNGSWLYSSREPRALPERSALSFCAPERSLVVVFSPLLGYGLDILLSRLPPDSRVLCLEAEESLYRLALESLPAGVKEDPRFSLLLAKEPSDLRGALPGLGRYRRALPLALSGGYRLHAASYDSLLSCFQREIGILWRNRATLSKLGRLWVRNLISNLAALPSARPLSDLAASAGDRPVIVAGAGPSLEELYRWLPAGRSSAFLLAVDTALPALRSAGILPDAVVCLEGQPHNLKDFIGFRGSRIPLIADLASHPVTLRCTGGDVYPVSSRFADCALLDRLERAGCFPGPIPPLGSVGVAALHIALELWGGRNPILVAGLDFAYRKGKIHARGAPSHVNYLASRTRLSPDSLFAASMRPGVAALPCPSGGSMLSDPVLSGYAELAREEITAHPRAAFDVRRFGIDLGLPPWSGELGEGGEHDVFPRTPGEPARTGSSLGASTPVDPLLLAELAAKEGDRARNLRRTLSGEIPIEGGGLSAMLRDCDYMSLHFPDRPDYPETDKSFLNRVSVEAEAAILRWENLERRLLRGQSSRHPGD